jgi:ferric-dicitrate binding protein FerR (iron transport regulator)
LGKDTFRISLPDSSQIDLSPGTSLYFYLRTRGTDILQRVISMNGQAFFKVSHVSPSNSSPLYIETARGEIKVLGTLFSLRDYRQEDSLSLIPSQGRLSLCNGHQTDSLEYPRTATIRTGKDIHFDKQYSTPERWIDKPDLFDFHGKSLSEAMSEIAAWYKLKVVFEDSVTARPYGDVLIGRPDKSLTIDQMLKILNGGDLLFQRSGQTIYVSRHDH